VTLDGEEIAMKQMSRRRLWALGVMVVLAGVAVVTAAGGSGTVADGLANPRGIALGPGGRILVAESATGAIDELRKGDVNTIATIPNAVDVAANGLGHIYVAVGGVAPGEPTPPPGPVPVSTLARVGPNGHVELVADIGAYQVAHPDPDDLDQPPNPAESNPNGLALLAGGNVLVADAAANDLLNVDVHGTITTVAHFKPEPVEWQLPFGAPLGTIVPAEAVPTAVAVGPDGAYYVSELTGFPFTKGAARIWRVAPGSVDVLCDPAHPTGGACTSFATGFSSVIDLAFGPDGTMYVLEIAKNGLAGALVLNTEFPPIGALWAVKDGVKTLISDSLVAPGGVAVDGSGRIFVTTNTFGPPGGSVVSLN
jgi:sugar lactone lactonase YvrE